MERVEGNFLDNILSNYVIAMTIGYGEEFTLREYGDIVFTVDEE